MALEKRTNEILRALSGDSCSPTTQHEHAAVDQRSRWLRRRRATHVHRRVRRRRNTNQYTAAAQDFEAVLVQLRQLIEVDLTRLEKQLEAAGAPWTPGRIPEWRDQ